MEELKIAVDVLKPHPRNQEFFDDTTGEAWDDFLRSIRTSGVIVPVVITEDNIMVSGHQRVRACKELGIKDIKYCVNHYETEDQILKDLIETNISQRGIGNPNPVKLGRCIKELERIYGFKEGRPEKLSNNFTDNSDPHTETELAERMGLTRQSLQNYKKLAELIPEVEDFLDTGMISATTALAIVKQLCIDDQKTLMSQLDKQTKYTQSEIQKQIDLLKQQPVEVIKEVTPEDYDSNKKELVKLSEELKTAKKKYKELKTKYETTSEELKERQNDIDYLLKEVDTEELENLRRQNAELLSQQASDKEEISRLQNGQYSPAAQEANSAYSFNKNVKEFIRTQISPLLYDGVVVNNQNNQCGEYIVEACNLLLDAAGDLLKKFKVQEVVYETY